MKAADLKNAAARFERFRPSKLLFTKLDESRFPRYPCWPNPSTSTAAPCLVPRHGQQIPEDLEAATTERILDGVFARDYADASEPGVRGATLNYGSAAGKDR